MMRHHMVVAYFASPKPLRKGNALGAIAGRLEVHKKTAPQSWGFFQRERNAYEREAVLGAVGKLRGDEHELFIKRASKIKYELHLTLRNRPLNHLIMRFPEDDTRGSDDFSRILSAVDDIASILEPEFGCLQPIIPDDRYYDHNKMAAYTFADLQQYGPFGLAARTWMGTHVIRLFRDVDWSRCADGVRENPWGGVRIDLVSDLESADIERLVGAEKCAKELLAPTGILATYEGPFHTRGENWHEIWER